MWALQYENGDYVENPSIKQITESIKMLDKKNNTFVHIFLSTKEVVAIYIAKELSQGERFLFNFTTPHFEAYLADKILIAEDSETANQMLEFTGTGEAFQSIRRKHTTSSLETTLRNIVHVWRYKSFAQDEVFLSINYKHEPPTSYKKGSEIKIEAS